jgi:uncharacterized membrane protein YdfJ with MMPL/SSD domain
MNLLSIGAALGVRQVKLFGLSLASAVFLDAFVIRSLLLPAVLELLGRWTWWFLAPARREAAAAPDRARNSGITAAPRTSWVLDGHFQFEDL